MINRTHPSDLARFRHTDFGYFAGGGVDGHAPAGSRHHESGPHESNVTREVAKTDSRYQARPVSIQFKGRWDK